MMASTRFNPLACLESEGQKSHRDDASLYGCYFFLPSLVSPVRLVSPACGQHVLSRRQTGYSVACTTNAGMRLPDNTALPRNLKSTTPRWMGVREGVYCQEPFNGTTPGCGQVPEKTIYIPDMRKAETGGIRGGGKAKYDGISAVLHRSPVIRYLVNGLLDTLCRALQQQQQVKLCNPKREKHTRSESGGQRSSNLPHMNCEVREPGVPARLINAFATVHCTVETLPLPQHCLFSDERCASGKSEVQILPSQLYSNKAYRVVPPDNER